MPRQLRRAWVRAWPMLLLRCLASRRQPGRSCPAVVAEPLNGSTSISCVVAQVGIALTSGSAPTVDDDAFQPSWIRRDGCLRSAPYAGAVLQRTYLDHAAT